MKAAEHWSGHTERFTPFTVGDHMCLQNQTGPHQSKWDKTGLVIEVRQFNQYVVRVDGSGWMTLCNREFLRKYLPGRMQQHRLNIDDDLRQLHTPPPKPDSPITPLPIPASTPPPPPSDRILAARAPQAVDAPAATSPRPYQCEPHVLNSPPHVHQSRPIQDTHPSALMEPLVPASPATPPTRATRPLTLPRLQDYNAKGLLEQ